MEIFLQQLITGIATGGIYACFALSLVLVYKSTNLVNFSQGEMAMLGAYVGLALLKKEYNLWLVFGIVSSLSFFFGGLIYLLLIRPAQSKSRLELSLITIGLSLIMSSFAGWKFGYEFLEFPTLFPGGAFTVLGLPVSFADAGVIVVCLMVMLLALIFFRFTNLGLAMRSSALDANASRILGLRVNLLFTLGWAVAATIGAVAAFLVAPVIFVSPYMMQPILIYAFAAGVLGGLGSPVGAVVGGFALGIAENLVGTYIPVLGPSMKMVVALFVIVFILVLRPSGLFDRRATERV